MAVNATMRAVMWLGIPYNMTVQNIPRPTIINGTDAIVRMSSAAICGSDLHMYHGTYGGLTPPWSMGHEGIGIVSEVGDAVSSLSVGDWVVIPDQIDNGNLQMDPETYHAFGSGTYLGGNLIGGTQAEYVSVPYADHTLIPVPMNNTARNTTLEHSYLFLSDIFATAWAGLDYAGFQPGDTVAIFGAGPVGLLAAYSATIRGASRVYSVDFVPERLRLAASIGAVPIDFTESDPVEQIMRHEPQGVTRTIDCVGYPALGSDLQSNQSYIINHMVELTEQEGGVGQIGVLSPPPPNGTRTAGPIPDAYLNFPTGEFFSKGLSYAGAGVDPKKYGPFLENLVTTGVANPSFIVSDVIGIEEAPEYYARFNSRNVTKVVIQFPW